MDNYSPNVSSPNVAAFLASLAENPDLRHRMKAVTTAEEISAVAADAGIDLPAATVVKEFARLLLEAEDDICIRNFNNLSWDHGELLWAAQTWQFSSEA